MNYLSLFSGIGGLDLGLDRAGMTCAGQVEKDPFCQRVLAKHWPEVPRHDDVRTAPGWWAGESRPAVRLVAGGPPCQPASRAGDRLGVSDPRWGWPWFLDVVRAVRPQLVLMENPSALLDLDRGAAFGWILGELAGLGFDAEWSVLSACTLGAPHVRRRLFIVAHTVRQGLPQPEPQRQLRRPAPERGWWVTEPDVGRVAHGVPARVDRLRGLGNAVVPQVAEHVGRLILSHAEGAA